MVKDFLLNIFSTRDEYIDSLGKSPQIISQIATGIIAKYNLEKSIGTISGNDKLSSDLKKLMSDVLCGKTKNIHDGFSGIGDKWGKYSKAFRRSVYLILSSFHESDLNRKQKTLDKAVNVLLLEISEKMTTYCNSLYIPTLTLFGLGMILPLIILSVFPVISFLGMGIGIISVILLLFTSLLVSFLYSLSILKKRPIIFSPNKIVDSDKFLSIDGFLFEPLILSFVILFLFSIPSIFYLLQQYGIVLSGWFGIAVNMINTYSILIGIVISSSVFFYSKCFRIKFIRDEVMKLENEFIHSLYHLRNFLADGKPLESSIESVSKLMSGSDISLPVDKVLDIIKIDSYLIKNTLKMIVDSFENGNKAAIKTTDVVYKYLIGIEETNKLLKNILDRNLSMMKTTAMFYAPIICGIVIVIFQMIVSASYGGLVSFGHSHMDPPVLRLIVGLYLFCFNFLIVWYTTKIEYGNDSIMLNFNMYRSFPVVFGVFLLTIIIAESILSGVIL